MFSKHANFYCYYSCQGYGDVQFTEEDIVNFINTENSKEQLDESIIAEDNDNNDADMTGSIKSDGDIKENNSIKEEEGTNNHDDIAVKESYNDDEKSAKEKLCPTCKVSIKHSQKENV